MAPPAGPLADALAAERLRLVPVQWRDAAGRRRSLEQLRAELAGLLQSLRPNLLHANSLSMGRLSGPVARDLKIPSLAHLRDIVGLSAAAVADLNCHARLLAVSAATRDFHTAQGVAADRLHVLHNGVDLGLFRPRPTTGWLHRQLQLPRHALLAGTIGQLVMRKGHDVLAAAAVELADLPDLHSVIVGERYSGKAEAVEYMDRVSATFGHAGLAGRVHFLGNCSQVELLLPELTMLVHPARQEPLGRVLLEAAACGLPVVATDVGGTAEIFPSGQTARLVPPGDSMLLAAAIRELAGNQRERAAMRVAVRHRAEAAFDIRQSAAGLLRHYQEVISSPNS